MGNRRFSRKRLFETEKLGKAVVLGSGAGIAPAIARATQHRNGQEIITEIVMDLGVASATLAVGGTENYAVGVSGLDSMITELTEAKFGIVSEVRAVVVEACSKNLDVILSTADNVAQGASAAAGRAKVIEDITTKGADDSADVDNGTVYSLYITDGAGGLTGDVADGKLLIYIHGFEAPADLA